jgi:transposase
LIDDMRAEWLELDRRIAACDNELAPFARSDADARRLSTIPGIGVLNATAMLAAIGDGQTFARGRDLAAWLGLVPRQVTTGGKPRRMIGTIANSGAVTTPISELAAEYTFLADRTGESEPNP